MRVWLSGLCGLVTALAVQTASADFLHPDQAFQLQAVSISNGQAKLTWKIADGYYLYHDQFKVMQGSQALALKLPAAEDKDDPNFGMTQVHYGQVSTVISTAAQQNYKVEWQGCADSGLCYPVQRTVLQTDADGLLPAAEGNAQTRLLNSIAASSNPNRLALAEKPSVQAEKKQPEESNIQAEPVQQTAESSIASEPLEAAADVQSPSSAAVSSESKSTIPAEAIQTEPKWNNDQFFFNLLSAQNIALNLLIFLGLGVLLAFLPCSLPLIPILSSILVQRHRGYRAGIIAGVFVLGMALVYALMGLAVAGLGYNFQRWFQNPVFIGIFALLFVAFALNLFGVFQLSLPQGLLQRLDQWQQRQNGGTFIGTFIMGMIAALIVGPCMSAPLAGALLFVSQLSDPWMGASYLFVLGLGVGLPLFIACVFGAQYLPKPGLWMDRLKFSFGFVMLLLAVYFLRPLLPSVLFLLLMAALFLLLSLYILLKMRPHAAKRMVQLFLVVLSLGAAFFAGNYMLQAWTQLSTAQAAERLSWQKVTTADEFKQALAQVKGRRAVIDVYADWCVACQPIEKEVIPRADVQAALADVARIKLDLTAYHASQDILLKEWQVLGPPTMIFLDAAHQEQRDLRLTGTFSASQLLSRLGHGAQP